MKIIPMFNLDGTAEDAIRFYQQAFGGEVTELMRYKDQPENGVGPEYADKVLAGTLAVQGDMLYFNDNLYGEPITTGNHLATFITCDSEEQITHIYDALKEGAREIKMELQHPFWSTMFAALTDKYGNAWTLNYQEKAEK